MKQCLLMVLFLNIAFSAEGQEAAWTASIVDVLLERVDAINARIDYYHAGGPEPSALEASNEALKDAPEWALVLIQSIESINARIDYYNAGGPAPETITDYRGKLGKDAPEWTSTLINTVNSINTSIDYYHGVRQGAPSADSKATAQESVPKWADTVIDDLEAVDSRIKAAGRPGRRPLSSGL